ncbi:MAG: hypothetical protein AAGA20_18590 [Planctomycetota bacterium]
MTSTRQLRVLPRASQIASAFVVAYFAGCDTTTPTSPPVIAPSASTSTSAPCSLLDIPFTVGLQRAFMVFKDLYIAPIDPKAPTYVNPALLHESKLVVSADEIKGDFAKIDAVTFGADWIPLQPAPVGSVWPFDPLTTGPGSGGPGWAILFYVRDNEVFALGWGGTTADPYETVQKIWGEGPELNAGFGTSPDDRIPFYGRSSFGRVSSIVAIDFGAAAAVDLPALPAGCPWSPADASDGTRFKGSSVYYSVEGSADVLRATPVKASDGVWAWTRDTFIPAADLQLSADDDIDALSIDLASGYIVFSLTEGSPSMAEFDNEPLLAAAFDDSDERPAITELPKPLSDPGGSGLKDVIGRRVRGVCDIDPRFDRQR